MTEKNQDEFSFDFVDEDRKQSTAKGKKEVLDGSTFIGEKQTANQFESYSIIKIHRSQIKNADYNPRFISEAARGKLKNNIKMIGLLGPITWNTRTGNIVSGHQRMWVMDSLMKTKDYEIQVAAVDLDEQTEKAQNVFMNNPLAQGDFDLELLEKMFKEHQVNFEAAGFTVGEIHKMLGDSPLVDQAEAMEEFAEKTREAQEMYANIQNSVNFRDDTDYYNVIVWSCYEERSMFAYFMGIEDDRFIDGKTLWTALESAGIVISDMDNMDIDAYEQNHGKKCFPMTIDPCPQCGGRHELSIVRQYTTDEKVAGRYTHWSFCSEKGEPILLAPTKEEISIANAERARIKKAIDEADFTSTEGEEESDEESDGDESEE